MSNAQNLYSKSKTTGMNKPSIKSKDDLIQYINMYLDRDGSKKINEYKLVPMNQWDVSKVQDMRDLFMGKP